MSSTKTFIYLSIFLSIFLFLRVCVYGDRPCWAVLFFFFLHFPSIFSSAVPSLFFLILFSSSSTAASTIDIFSLDLFIQKFLFYFFLSSLFFFSFFFSSTFLLDFQGKWANRQNSLFGRQH